MTIIPANPTQAVLILADPIVDGFKIKALHEYTDAKGNIVFWRIRLKHPNFESLPPEIKEQYHGKNKWMRPMIKIGDQYYLKEPKFSPTGKIIYKLHELTARLDEVVYVTEGENKADALAGQGLLATTSGAADSAAKADWQPLKGRTVIIWPDNDAAGERYKEQVTEQLLALGCMVSVIEVSMLGLTEKGDVVDWLEAHPYATADDIRQLPCQTIPNPADTWPDPNPIESELLPVAPFNADALLPDSLKAWVMDVAQRMSCPPDYVAAATIVALGSVIGARCVIKPKRYDDWAVVPNLWGGIVGLPSAKKTPAMNAALKPMDRLIAKAMEDFEKGEIDFSTKKLVHDAREKALGEQLKQAAKNETKQQSEDNHD